MKNTLSALDAVRAFYIAEELVGPAIEASKGDANILRKKLAMAVRKASKMPLTKMMTEGIMYGPRFDNYFNSRWELKMIPLSEMGLWPRTGGLPDVTTRGSVIDTAEYLRPYVSGEKRITASMSRVRYIKRLAKLTETITEAIPIIVFTGGILRNNKLITSKVSRNYKECKYDIDDGNHRAISLALSGKTQVMALVGTRITKSPLLFK